MRYTRDKILENKRKAEGQKEIEEVFLELVKASKKEEKKASADKK